MTLMFWFVSAGAQENLDAGKTGAQLFASDCALCHKSPQELKRVGGLMGLGGFLREHYTASPEAANAIAAYLQSAGSARGSEKRQKPGRRGAKGGEQVKPGEKKPAATTETKPKDGTSTKPAKPAEARTSQPKTSESKTTGRKTAKRLEPRTAGAKISGAKTAKPKADKEPAEAKANQGSSAAAAKSASPDMPKASEPAGKSD